MSVTQSMSVQQRVQAIGRADQALRWLETHPAITRSRLGAARDQVNLVHNLSSGREVWDAVVGLEASVVEVYYGIPTGAEGNDQANDQAVDRHGDQSWEDRHLHLVEQHEHQE